jgi:F0F1-type ATP synthase membrane subunit a
LTLFLLPQGVPFALAPFLVLLEAISYCFRALSLGIRLFANMMAGHSLVKILSGFAWTMLSMGGRATVTTPSAVLPAAGSFCSSLQQNGYGSLVN